MWRAALTADALLDLEEVCEALPGRPSEASAWVLANVQPCGELAGVLCWRWGDVLAALRDRASPTEAGAVWVSTAEAAARLGVARSTLDEMVTHAPKDLPGAPVHVGGGKARQHLRWDAGRLVEWLTSYRAWEASAKQAAKTRPTVRRTSAASTTGDGPVDWAAVARGFRR
ncbi:MAG: hypothetical protein ACOZNI_27695 [Myxococcota bacterium]